MKPEFLKEVQRQGWAIEQVKEDRIIAKCPAAGCAVRATLKLDRTVPAVDPTTDRDRRDVVIDSFDALREVLRERRNDLALNIRETEEITGMAVDHLAKIEKPEPSRLPNFQIMLELAQALGYEMVLRPAPLPPFSVRVISDTRSKFETRQRRLTRTESRRRKILGEE